MHRYRWKTRPDVGQLEQAIDQLRIENIWLRREVANKDRYIGRLKFLCRERMTRIDDLHGRLEQARAANQRLSRRSEFAF